MIGLRLYRALPKQRGIRSSHATIARCSSIGHGGASVDGAAADALPVEVMMCSVAHEAWSDGAQIGHMVGSVIGFVFDHRNASAELFDLWH